MTRPKVSTTHTEYAKVAKVVERLQSDLAAAKSHSTGRDRRVGQVMCYLSLMRSAGLIMNFYPVTCTEAILQHFSSSRAEGKQAAHFLPGQLRINGRYPWEFIRDWNTSQDLKGLFGDVENLPADFNKADSAAEAYLSPDGLRNAFAQSCQTVVQDPQPLAGNKINRVIVGRAYRDWIERSRKAYRMAIAQKETKVNVPPLKVGEPGCMHFGERDLANIHAHHEAMERDQHYIAQTEFLKQYLANIEPQTLSDFLMNEIERKFRACRKGDCIHTITITELEKFEGRRIDTICDCAYHNNADNHCAHFVSHALDLSFGSTCKSQTGKGTKGANIRVHEIFARCGRVGKWSDRPANLMVCLAFVTAMGNVSLATKKMTNVPKKHIGIYHSGNIWHYSNIGDKVVKQTPEKFARHYPGTDIGLFYGEIPK